MWNDGAVTDASHAYAPGPVFEVTHTTTQRNQATATAVTGDTRLQQAAPLLPKGWLTFYCLYSS